MAFRAARRPAIRRQYRQQQRTVLLGYACVVLSAAFFFQIMRIYGPRLGALMAVFVTIIGVTVARPAMGVGIGIVLAIVGDGRAMPWWPVTKNLSSRESVLYMVDGVTVSPIEVIVAVALVVWLISRQLDPNSSPVVYGPLFRPLLVFTGAMAFGMAWGVLRGGDLRIAVIEIRPLVLIPLVYLAVTNLFTTVRHYQRVVWGVIAALVIESVHGLWRLPRIRVSFPGDQSPVDHTAALHMNIVMLMLVALLWFGSKRIGSRPMLLILLLPVTVMYLESERRAAVVALLIGFVALAVVLFNRDPAKFRRILPIMTLLGLVYLGAFWTVEDNQLGFPAQAVKMVVDPEAATEKDASSDLYREIENYNMWATVRSNPILGIGFGQKFLRPYPLPDISFFTFWEYIPHNSILWLWTQVGVVGFLAFLYSAALAISMGVRAATRIRDPNDAAVIAVMTAFVAMTIVVAYVDITFDAQTTVLLALGLALATSAERLVGSGGGTDTGPVTRPAPARESVVLTRPVLHR